MQSSRLEYRQVLDFLFSQLPVFQIQGPGAYKPGLDTTLALARAFGNPHENLKFIHIAGTNGKGSTAHSLASVLQASGLRTGLFTSPHLVDFRERIRLDGKMISRREVVDFMKRYFALQSDFRPNFFELTTIMAFDFFKRQGVDVAVIETGLGGRLDSTNIITPALSVITNISLDHTALLGHTEEAIAGEKAGIIKPGVPVVVGAVSESVSRVIKQKATDVEAPLYFSQGEDRPYVSAVNGDHGIEYDTRRWGKVRCSLSGDCQRMNAATVLRSLEVLSDRGWPVTAATVTEGLGDVEGATGLMGRWMKISDKPLTICDTGHNPDAWQWLGPRLVEYCPRLKMVIGFVGDKDVDSILDLLPKDAVYYFTAPSVSRRLPADVLASKAAAKGLRGQVFTDVSGAWRHATADALRDNATVFVGGSSFVVANLLETFSVDNMTED